ncbi:MAG TPA: biotin transporter BioY [Propionicimonas sp.]|nr:biotin transporter BioY [Propionicimonas sp.]HQA77533.1 biotin transporter BioY [Propionicimonas sp.]HQD96122.1 biotin transporter BioY [Propionicimonas sp.]
MARPAAAPGADLALIAVFAALIAVFSLTPIPAGVIGVPITLQTLAVALAGLVLGAWRGFLATLLYVVVGLAGLPVLAGGAAGIGVLAGPTAGYLLSFPLAAAATGAIAAHGLRRPSRFHYLWLGAAAIAGAVLVTTPLGIAGLMVNAGLPLSTATVVALGFVPLDLVKMLVAAAIALAVHKAFPALLASRAAVVTEQ